MKIWLETDRRTIRAGEPLVVRLLVLNDTYEPDTLDRRLLIGPNPAPAVFTGMPMPVSVEPVLSPDERNSIVLNPFGLYGRQRSFDNLAAGRVVVHAYLLRSPTSRLLPAGPADASQLLVAAEPLVVTVEGAAPAR